MAHDQPTYASVPGIRVFGMMCVKPGNTNVVIRKPAPPKRDQYQQSPYYQRYKKHATMSPTENDRVSRQTDIADMATSATISDRADDHTSTFDDNTSMPVDNDEPSEDLNALPQEIETRIKRMIDQLNVNTNSISRQSRSIVDGDGEEASHDEASSRNSNSYINDIWPDVSWPEINKQIGDIHWERL